MGTKGNKERRREGAECLSPSLPVRRESGYSLLHHKVKGEEQGRRKVLKGGGQSLEGVEQSKEETNFWGA